MLTTTTLVIIVLTAVYVAIAPQPEPDLLLPGPSLLDRWRERQVQNTLEMDNTLDWIARVKDVPASAPGPRRHRPVETVAGRPPWNPEPQPEHAEDTMAPDYYSGKNLARMLSGPPPPRPDQPPRFWPAGQTGAHALVRAALDRPLYGPPDQDPEPAPESEPDDPGPEAEQGWPPEPPADPADSTIVRGIKAFTAEALDEYERGLPGYGRD